MSKPVTFIPAGGKPVTLLADGGLPVSSISAGGQPMTLVPAGGMPITDFSNPASLFADGRAGFTAAPLPGYVFADTAGTVPATIGGTVARVNSPVAGQTFLVQGTAADRPVWQTSGGLYWLEGNGVNQFMVTDANVDMSGLSAATMVAGLEQVGASNALIWHRNGTSDGSLGITSGSTDASRWRAIIANGGVFHFASATAPLPTRKVAAAVSDRSVADFLRIRINGEQIAEEKPGVSGNMLNVPLAIFATTNRFFYSNARWFGHTFCAMTAAELARVEAYHAYLTGETLA